MEISTSVGKEREIIKTQFYQALADSVTARLLPESESDLRTAVEVLDVNSWPQDMPVEFGEVEIRFLSEKFLVPMSEVKNEFRDHKDSRGKTEMGKVLRHLVNRVNSLPISTASCERGFSKMNAVSTATRTCLSVPHVLLDVHLNDRATT